MAKIEIGDTVQLKSGGPIMTVEAITDRGYIRCQWFDGSKIDNSLFKPESLKKIEEEEKGNE